MCRNLCSYIKAAETTRHRQYTVAHRSHWFELNVSEEFSADRNTAPTGGGGGEGAGAIVRDLQRHVPKQGGTRRNNSNNPPPPKKKKSTPLEPYRRFGDISISALGIRAGWFSQSVSPTPDNCSSEKRVHPIRTPEKRAHVRQFLIAWTPCV